MSACATSLACLLFATLGASCAAATSARTKIASPLVVHYRMRSERSARPVVATRVYRGFVASSLASRCRMVPTDSQAFDVNAHRCGMLSTMLSAISRVYLERGASTRFLEPVVVEGHLRWLDEPTCAF